MKKILLIVVILLVVIAAAASHQKDDTPIRVGWISDLTGPVAKYGAIEAARIAVDEINNEGGINGRELLLIEEDGKCNPKEAVNAARKLIDVDQVDVILGGHCSPETLSIAPYAEQNGVVVLASISTSPAITTAGDYIFRTSPPSTEQSVILTDYLRNERNIESIAILYEETAYAEPIASALRKNFSNAGGVVALYEGFGNETVDFRTELLKAKAMNVDALYIAPQHQDRATMIVTQASDLGLEADIFGNDILGSQAFVDQTGELSEGIIFGAPAFDKSSPLTVEFIEKYTKRYNVDNIPYDIWTAESYDAVHILADAMRNAGTEPEEIRDALYEVNNYQGASGNISIDENGDGIRNFVLKSIKNGEVVELK